MIRIISWNINSVRLRCADIARLAKKLKPDILCLQETKCPDDVFPAIDIAAMGYPHQHYWGMKGYNGVAILSQLPLADLRKHPHCGQHDARHISCRIDGKSQSWALHNVYVPAGGDIADPKLNPKFAHKVAFLEELIDWSQHINEACLVAGDFNIAPLEHDVWSHRQLLKVVSHTPVEVAMIERMRDAADWCDTVRHIAGDHDKIYSWWSYRAQDYLTSNRGRRLDHIWINRSLCDHLRAAFIADDVRGWPRPSDHAPVVCDLDVS